ncbi:MAG TPA: antitoxin Xre/MbcA/ParS toxin-binding domain-containing protein [Thermohalobaculum sp.]|nr:antitoxin Xre/MbcA/ParS toxin-binding domain-containing protein [Thermohalobaculum sp.]
MATDDPDIHRTLAILGGPGVFDRPIHNRLEAHDILQEGLPALVLKHLVNEVTMLGGTRGELEKAIGMSLRTFQRRRAAAKALSREQSSRAWKFAEILGRVTEILGSRAEAEAWLQRPAMALDQRRPIDLLSTQAGVEAVEDHLTRMEYGVFA